MSQTLESANRPTRPSVERLLRLRPLLSGQMEGSYQQDRSDFTTAYEVTPDAAVLFYPNIHRRRSIEPMIITCDQQIKTHKT